MMDDGGGEVLVHGEGVRGSAPKRSLLSAAGDVNSASAQISSPVHPVGSAEWRRAALPSLQQHKKKRDTDAVTDKRVTWSP